MKNYLLYAIAIFLCFASCKTNEQSNINPRGLFRMQQISHDDYSKPVIPPYEAYKYCGDSLAIHIEVRSANDDFLCFLIQNVDKKPLNFTGFDKDSKEIQVFDTAKDRFTLRWYNDRFSNSSYFPYNNYSNELYTKDSIRPDVSEAIDMLKMDFDSDYNIFTGVWKRRGMITVMYDTTLVYEVSPMYKIYSPEKVMVFNLGDEKRGYEWAECRVAKVNYYDERTINEHFSNGHPDSPCIITWVDHSSFTLTFLSYGHSVTEVWDRSGLPESFQRIFGTDIPITEKKADITND